MTAPPCPLCDIPTDERPSLLCCVSNHPGYSGPSVEALLLAPAEVTRDATIFEADAVVCDCGALGDPDLFHPSDCPQRRLAVALPAEGGVR